MKILKKGVLSTFQDQGRFGYQSVGVNTGGAMDSLALRLLNIILGNHSNEAALEIHFPGPHIEFEESCIFAITGADFNATLNEKLLTKNKIYQAKSGDYLVFKHKLNGERLYFGVKGGFEISDWLHSKSTNAQLNFPEFSQIIALRNKCELENSQVNYGVSFDYDFVDKKIRFVPSFEFDELDIESKDSLLNSEFLITKDSNRMGYRLSGEPLALLQNKEMVSASVTKGTIQLLPDGQLIVLMADAQVSGGYPKLGFVIEKDVSKLSQLGFQSKIEFEMISYELAVEIMLQTEKTFNLINKSLKLCEKEN
ncbi:biotin-dependent carboxyltransferase family protein [Lacihabitans sp. CCS-44]|uniref:5-oxoprolinase subunit C family protein n=1 Tax=Lacihabitans sp. CCS-44 TaxID=2487331 RepID=UPI0020CC106F|nr:biotin-dependent carboxyltransferase family protein [Lacihabitans sp. CCS-44]MCP9756942.1 biotin-dependent carboxyltransferase family protein [Lacihabitans sp. CCS-44]